MASKFTNNQKQKFQQQYKTDPVDEDSLDEFDKLQRDLQADGYQVVVQNHKRQEIVEKVERLQFWKATMYNLNHFLRNTFPVKQRSEWQ